MVGTPSSTIRPFLLFFFMNLSISRCQLVSVTSGATTRTGDDCFSDAIYANVCTVLPRPISSASNALPEDFKRKSRPIF